jgi:rod shape-determining protein MreC
MIRLSPQLRAAVQRAMLPLLVLVSAAIVVLGKADQVAFDSVRIAVSDAAAPVLAALSRPIAVAGGVIDRARLFVMTYRENVRLEDENRKLLQWQQAALNLAADNRQLRGLLKAVPETAVSYVTARVIANSGGAFVRMILVNAGIGEHLRRGQAVITGEGLVGRLTEVGSRAARVLLITDLNSRIPVIVESTHGNAVLAGDNSERPRLMYLAANDGVKVGDRVVTSGEGGVFPPGLPVGVVATIDSLGPRVEPYVELSQLAYVMVVDYGLAQSLPEPVQVLARPGRRGRHSAADASLRH